ncbi:MAG TPA: hypothetical protein VFI23_17400 [Rhizomicrobium sp.]|nr:hypothetical protein [Rhizomicrobium sp.]
MKAFAFQAAFFEPLARTAGARVVSAQFFDQFFVTVDNAVTALNGGFAVESPSGVYSWVQKLKSWLLRRILAS